MTERESLLAERERGFMRDEQLRQQRQERLARVAKARTIAGSRIVGGAFAVLLKDAPYDKRTKEQRAAWACGYQVTDTGLRLHRHSRPGNPQDWETVGYDQIIAATDAKLRRVIATAQRGEYDVNLQRLAEVMNAHMRKQESGRKTGEGKWHRGYGCESTGH